MSIIILSRHVHSGKTTGLLQWCSRRKNVQGVLMPDINGSRKIMNIRTTGLFDIECTDANTHEPLTTVGRFRFYTRAFEKANTILSDALHQNPPWLIIDECGRLELQGMGFYPSIAKALSLYSDKKNNGHLVITVRDSLYAEAMRFFHIENHILIDSVNELDKYQ